VHRVISKFIFGKSGNFVHLDEPQMNGGKLRHRDEQNSARKRTDDVDKNSI